MSDTKETTTEEPMFKVQAMDANEQTPFIMGFDHFVAAASQAFLLANLTVPGFSDLPQHEKVQALVNGTLAGVISIVMSKMKEGYEEKAIEYVTKCAEPAGHNAKNLLNEYRRQMAERAKSDQKLN